MEKKKINSLIDLHIHSCVCVSVVPPQEQQVLRDCQENLEKKENMEFWDPQDCKDYLDHKAEKVNSIQCCSTGHVTAPDINTLLVVKIEKA